MADKKFAVFGAGGVGGYFAAALTRAGCPVALIARGRHLDAIRRDGLQIESPKEAFTVNLEQVTDRPQDVGPVDAVILAVKTWQVKEAAGAIRPMLSPSAKVLPLQNGVEAPEQLEAVLGRQHVLVGLCRLISSVVAPGHIRHAGLEPMIALGEPGDGPLTANAAALASALKAAGMQVQTPANIQAALWEKLLFIAAVSGVGAVTRSAIGEFRDCSPTRSLLQQIMEEVAAVARSRGVELTADVVTRTLGFVDSLPPTGTASMQRDIAEGRPSELAAIIGAVVRFGERSGVATPVANYVYASLLPQETRARRIAK